MRNSIASDESSLSGSRSSVLSGTRAPAPDALPIPKRPPLLTLRLSSPSFLDAVVHDTRTGRPVYTIETMDTLTTITRSDPLQGPLSTAEIRWTRPSVSAKGKAKEGAVRVQMQDLPEQRADAFLQTHSRLSVSHKFLPSSAQNAGPTHKFYIPGYRNALRWKHHLNAYACTAASSDEPIAILESVDRSEPGRPIKPAQLTVYRTLQDKYDTRSPSVHSGVLVLLLDHLLVTALLLSTDPQEWMAVQKYDGQSLLSRTSLPRSPTAPDTLTAGSDGSISCASAYVVEPGKSCTTLDAASLSASTEQWRKIMYGEPLFPKLLSTAANDQSPTPSSLDGSPATSDTSVFTDDARNHEPPDDVLNIVDDILLNSEEPVSQPTSAGGADGAGDSEDVVSIGPSSRASSPFAAFADDERAVWRRTMSSTRPPSPSAESVTYPLGSSSAPAHRYLDPSYYCSNSRGRSSFSGVQEADEISPVPRVPAHFVSAMLTRGASVPANDVLSPSSRSALPSNRRPLSLQTQKRPSTSPASPAFPLSQVDTLSRVASQVCYSRPASPVSRSASPASRSVSPSTRAESISTLPTSADTRATSPSMWPSSPGVQGTSSDVRSGHAQRLSSHSEPARRPTSSGAHSEGGPSRASTHSEPPPVPHAPIIPVASSSSGIRRLPRPPNAISVPTGTYNILKHDRRKSQYTGRSLPPTPTLTLTAHQRPPLPHHTLHKDEDDDLAEWMQVLTSQPSASPPPPLEAPPAYNTLFSTFNPPPPLSEVLDRGDGDGVT
ncbi:hypothetical protein FISHEDRAFT_71994 [Fistulina hepatica ATCC 64428]|uniref:Uncharacterized protein n=1 Tax=Fistulina hepatica ATCC 64428 TaxID=1128425 RepID=A0A0D7AG42_9AGAR|nr:hypothetical protein FISHEDRAFT_71994 [Fistulina hepatica ATCC 64428]